MTKPNGTKETIDTRSNEAFRTALRSLAAARRASLVRGAVSMVIAAALAAFSVLVFVYRLAPGWSLFPIAAFTLFWASIAVSLAIAAAGGAVAFFDRRRLADELGGLTGRGSFFSSALEFSRGGERLEAYSPLLVTETVRRAGGELRGLQRWRLYSGFGRPGWAAAGICVGLLAVFISGGSDTRPVLRAISDPGIYFRTPRGFNLHAVSGDSAILSGSDFTAEAIKLGSLEGGVTLETSYVPGVWKSISLVPDTASSNGVSATIYRHTVKGVREDFSYHFEAGGERTRSHRVTVMRRPVINRLSAVLEYPPYTQAPPETIATLAGRLVAIRGTRVELEGETSAGVSEGALEFSGAGRSPVEVFENGFRCSFTVQASDTFFILVTDSLGLENEHTIHYPVIALEDRPPYIELVAPDDGALLPRSQRTEIRFDASDDYGISMVRLKFLREGKEEDFSAIDLAPTARNTREIEGRYIWSLEDVRIFPGDKILYFMEAFDNNPETGYARTEARRLIVPSLSQIYADIREQEMVQQEDMESVLEKGEEIRDRLKALGEDFKSERTLDWSSRREGQEIMKAQRELREKITEAADQLDRTLQTLERNKMTSQEIGEKMEEIQRLLREIESEELKDAIERFRKMLGEIPPENIAEEMAELEMSSEKLVERLDRTIELLKQVLKEEQMEALVRRMEEMLDEQKALRDSTRSGDREDLSGRQDELGDDFEKFREDYEEFSAAQEDSSLASQMEKLAGEMREKAPEDKMRQAADEIEEDEREQAVCTQSSTVDDMLALYTSLGRCQMSMGLTMEREVIERLARAARELVEVSRLQEDIVPRLAPGAAGGVKDDLIAEQLILQEAARTITQDLYALARKSMMLSSEVFIHLGGALGGMEATLSGIEQKKHAEARKSAGFTYHELNLAVIALLEASSTPGGSGGSMRERMQMMSEQQLSIDRQLKQMMNGSRTETWSQEERARMQRIAAEQRKMQELLEQIAEESRGAGELLGRLDDLSSDMSEVAEKLERGELDSDLLDREERVLSRMLESQRSLQRKDYARERTSRTADDVPALSAGELEDLVNDREMLLDMIRRAMQERGPAEYEDLIRLYFRALSRKVREEQQ